MNEGFGQIPMDEIRLKKYGANQGRGLKAESTLPSRQLGEKIRRELSNLEYCRHSLEMELTADKAPIGGEEWILDNCYLAQREGRWAVQALLNRGRLRCCGGETILMTCARGGIFAVPQLEISRLTLYLEGFQSSTPLTEGELSLLVPALVCALVEQITTLALDEERRQSQCTAQQMSLLFGGLRGVGVTEWEGFLERQSRVDTLLRRDPTGQYSLMDSATRHHYRNTLCRQARSSRVGEEEYALQLLRKCQQSQGDGRHVGYHLLHSTHTNGLGAVYGCVILLLTLLLTATAGWMLKSWLVTLLLAFPISDLVKNLVDFMAVRLVPPRPICRMALEEGIPQEGRTLCVIATLLTGDDQNHIRHLEQYRLANRDSGVNLRLGLLVDLPDSHTPITQEGWQRVWKVQREIEKLNEVYDNGFYLLFRIPTFNRQDDCYQGWERKRGALLSLNGLILGRETDIKVLAGDEGWLSSVRYVITLDGDTALTVGAARELVGGMLHPLNRPVLDEKRRVVVSGHALLQPRVSVGLQSANKTTFSRIIGGQGGIDPYGSTASEVYHDLFDDASYTGKGIYDVKIFHTCLEGRFPTNTVLSHDLLEGSYLRCGLLSQVELTDGIPSGVDGYFARLHRWVRGDWQLIPWIGTTVPDGRGGRERNPLTPLARFKILDNLRRSLSPLFTLISLVLGVCFSDLVFVLAGGVAVLAAASNLLLSGAELTARRGVSTHVRYHSTIIFGLAGVILQTLLLLVLLPYQAFISTSAAVTALYRSYVSGKKCLEWVTAAQIEGQRDGLLYYARRQWCAILVGAITLIGADVRFGGVVGIIWMLSPALSWYLSRPKLGKKPLAQGERTFLLHEANQIWGYFQRFLTPENHFLPPDNWQEQPSVGVANRTSPTNIGMALLSILSAVDLDILTKIEGETFIEQMLNTVEQLDKWHGHLYNWYDIRTTKPLSPRYVSTVDSGNLCGCLIALEQGLGQWGSHELSIRAGNLASQMEFSVLYDEERKLFSIGWEEERGQLTQGWYDLLASEARQTSFIAVARGEVESRHWRRLGRMMVGQNDYRGLASWTGTMFEYLMPNLLLPCEENSLMYESLCFCVYAQQIRGRQMGTPWGISESGYYAFDAAMNYQYCAHGVQTLGLKRGLDDQHVLAPYATFLALLIAPHRGIENLKKLRQMGIHGVFGLYEAVDYTPSRQEGATPFAVVRSYMSHHLGMSLIAIDNVLCGNVMQRRFMANGQMSAYQELLQERVPMGAPVLKRQEGGRGDEPLRHRPTPHQRQGEGYGRRYPNCHLLSSGSYSVLCCDNGLTLSKLGDYTLLRRDFGDYYAPSGISAFLLAEGETTGLTAAPLYGDGSRYSWEFYSGGAIWQCKNGGLTTRTQLIVPGDENGELRSFNLRWEGVEPLKGELLIYLEPMLSQEKDYRAHPIFSKLFLESIPTEQGISFRRRPREGEQTPVLSVLWQGEEVTYTTARELALGRGGLRAISSRSWGPLGNEGGEQTDPCLMLRMAVNLQSGEETSVRLALSASDHLASSLDGARKILQGKGRENHRLSALAYQQKLGEKEMSEGMELLRRLVSCPHVGQVEQSALWQFGVSGDAPIAMAEVDSSQVGLTFCGMHQLLSRSGYPFDLVLLVEEGGDYRQPVASALREGIKMLGAEGSLGVKYGIHILSSGGDCFRQWGCVSLPITAELPQEDTDPPPQVKITAGDVPWIYDKENNFTVITGDNLPPLGWSQVLCNPQFGWITDETGGGYFWLENAREGRLTPWDNDPLAVGGRERITLTLQGRSYSLFADGDGHRCEVTYGFGTARWRKEIGGETLESTAFVPWDSNRRILTVSWTGGLGTLCYRQGDEPPMIRPMGRNQNIILETKPSKNSLETGFIEKNIPEMQDTVKWWYSRVSPIQVDTPDENLNHYLNGWALYQVLACRLFARTSQYQNGGAYGFRDQLQDVCALLYTAPQLAKEQLLRAGARQFEEGDVQHWWHPPHGAGVRTRISDDLLWLPYVLSRYVEVTGDWEICDHSLPYLTAPPLKKGEQDRYDTPGESCKSDSLYRHSVAAIECFLCRGLGVHGLPLMGAGDWNDGMNRVGEEGRGESLWLAWFGGLVLQQFIPVCEKMEDNQRAERYRQWASTLISGAENNWDGNWYRRGYFDDGTPLGASGNDQCAIDSLAQSFSAFVSGSNAQHSRQAIRAAVDALYDPEGGIVKLFTPPFTHSGKDAGYIGGYLPGVRENGGQYTHGAVWLARGCLMVGDSDTGYQLLQTLLPSNHPQQIYRAEPYVLGADVYATRHHLGRAGWSWYTGAAGWYYRTAIEDLLGIQIKNKQLTIRPNLPAHWTGYSVIWQFGQQKEIKIKVKRTGTPQIRLDGKECREDIPIQRLTESHNLEVSL